VSEDARVILNIDMYNVSSIQFICATVFVQNKLLPYQSVHMLGVYCWNNQITSKKQHNITNTIHVNRLFDAFVHYHWTLYYDFSRDFLNIRSCCLVHLCEIYVAALLFVLNELEA